MTLGRDPTIRPPLPESPLPQAGENAPRPGEAGGRQLVAVPPANAPGASSLLLTGLLLGGGCPEAAPRPLREASGGFLKPPEPGPPRPP